MCGEPCMMFNHFIKTSVEQPAQVACFEKFIFHFISHAVHIKTKQTSQSTKGQTNKHQATTTTSRMTATKKGTKKKKKVRQTLLFQIELLQFEVIGYNRL